MANDDFNPSAAVVTEARIFSYFEPMIEEGKEGKEKTGYDIIQYITQVSFTQSIDASGYRGSIYIVDKDGIINNFRGEEKLILKVKSFDLNTEIKLYLQVYQITGVQPDKNLDGMSYVINFVSQTTYEASKLNVIEPFSDKEGSYIVEKLFRKYYNDNSNLLPGANYPVEEIPFETKKYKINKGKLLYVQPTDGVLRVVIPNYTPGEAMDFICKKSYSTKTPSSMYRFFETFSKFYFVTDEFLITKAHKNPKQIIELTYNPYVPLDAEDPMDQVNAIEGFSNPSRVNTIADMYSGGYKNVVGEIDLVRRDYTETVFSYKDDGIYYNMVGEKMNIKDNIHTEAFMDETFTEDNAPQFMVFRDFRKPGDLPSSVVRGDQHYADITSRRVIWNHHITNNSVNISLKGRLDIEPGMVIKIIVPEFTTDEKSKVKLSEQYSGNYLVHSISHTIKDDVLNTEASLYKFDWSS